MKATAKAHTNIALIKYWGKRNEQLFLPMNSSLSITLDQFYTVTTVKFSGNKSEDVLFINDCLMGGAETKKVTQFLDRLRTISGIQLYATIRSENKVPTAAGFASSASGFAALAAAAVKALQLDVDKKELSQIARQGSGSACRSIYGGFVEWQKGEREDGTDSYAVSILDEQDWRIAVLSVVLTSQPKQVLSREGMKRTVDTSPFYDSWVKEAGKDLTVAKAAIQQRDFSMLGQVAEANALKMHATMLGAQPPFFYWQSATLEVMHRVHALRSEGILAYFTIDAGPNVKILCEPENVPVVSQNMEKLAVVEAVHICYPGPGVSYVSATEANE